MKGRVFSINQSQAKGVPKLPVKEGYLKEGWGLLGDAHSGKWHRQISLLSWESIKSQNECHTHCAIYKRVGKCIMPKEGIFAEVLKGGKVEVGDEIRIGLNDENRNNHGE